MIESARELPEHSRPPPNIITIINLHASRGTGRAPASAPPTSRAAHVSSAPVASACPPPTMLVTVRAYCCASRVISQRARPRDDCR